MIRTWSWRLVFRVLALAAVLAVAVPLILACFSLGRGLGRFVQTPGEMLSGALRPRVDVQSISATAITALRQQSKLVVLEAAIDVDVTRNESYRSWGVYWGTNHARVLAQGNHVQYVIPLENLSTAQAAYSEASHTLTITVPAPRLDEEFVSVQSDPAQCRVIEQSAGWCRRDLEATVFRARQALRPQLLAQGRSEVIRSEANRAGLRAVQAFVEPLVTNLTRGEVKVEVRYARS